MEEVLGQEEDDIMDKLLEISGMEIKEEEVSTVVSVIKMVALLEILLVVLTVLAEEVVEELQLVKFASRIIILQLSVRIDLTGTSSQIFHYIISFHTKIKVLELLMWLM